MGVFFVSKRATATTQWDCLRHNQAREAPEMGIQSEVKAGLLCYFEHVEMNVRILMPGKCDKLNLTGLLRLNDSFHSATFGKYSGRVVIPQYFVVRQQIDVVCPSASDPASAMLLFFDTTATAIAQKFSPLHSWRFITRREPQYGGTFGCLLPKRLYSCIFLSPACILVCRAQFVPVEMRQTGTKGAPHGTREEAHG